MIIVQPEKIITLSTFLLGDFITRTTYDLASRYPYVKANNSFDQLHLHVNKLLLSYKNQGLQYYSTLAFNTELHFLFGYNFLNNPLFRIIREKIKWDSSQSEEYYYGELYNLIDEICNQTIGEESKYHQEALKRSEVFFQEDTALDRYSIQQNLKNIYPEKYNFFEHYYPDDLERFLAKMKFTQASLDQIILQFVFGDDYHHDPLMNLSASDSVSSLFLSYFGE